MPRKAALLVLLLIVGVLPVLAQQATLDPNTPSVLDIHYGDSVHETITNAAFYDWWTIDATQGDDMVIHMTATDGLEPLIGILNGSGDLVAKSDDGAVNSTAELEYVVPATGHYTIVATRVGNLNGTSTGSYALDLRQANAPVVNVNPYQDVTFTCKDEGFDVTTAATLSFADDPVPGLEYRITVYGIDGFRPVIRVNFDASNAQPYELCNIDALNTVGDTFTFPGEQTQTITKDTLNQASQLALASADQMGTITLTIGSENGQAGRYMAVIEGFSIEPSNDIDGVEIRVGPLAAKTTSILAYMIAGQNSRLDPFMKLPDSGVTCDDAGRGDCTNVPSFNRAGVTMHEDDGSTVSYIGDRSDAGLLINPGNPDPVEVQLSSRESDTHGPYALLLIGSLPPRSP